MADARETLKGLCPHELLSTTSESPVADTITSSSSTTEGKAVGGGAAAGSTEDLVVVASTSDHIDNLHSSAGAGKHSHLCVKLKADAVLEAGSEIVQDAVHVASDVATNVVVSSAQVVAAAAAVPAAQPK